MDRILIDITGFIPNKNYGAQTFILNFLKELNLKNDIGLIIICSKRTKEFLKLKNLNIKSFFIPEKLVFRVPYCFILINYLNLKFKPKKIFYPLNISYTWGRKSLIYLHDLVCLHYMSKEFKFKYLKYYLLFFYYKIQFLGKQKIAVPSKYIKSELFRVFKKKDVKIIREGLVFNKKVSSFKENSESYIFLVNSFNAEHKNIEDLFLAIENIWELNKKIQFRFTGHNNSKVSSLSKRIKHKNIKIIQTGYLNENQMFEELSKSDCLIYCSEYEGFGLPVIEAIELEKKILCSDIEVLREFYYEGQIFYKNFDFLDLKEKILSQAYSKHKKLNFKRRKLYNWKNIVSFIYE